MMRPGALPETARERMARERRLREIAALLGLAVERCRAFDSSAPGFGTFRVVDATTGAVIAGDPVSGFGLDLDALERVLLR